MHLILFLYLFFCLFISKSVNGNLYPQKQIDEAFKRYRSKTELYVEEGEHLGCWPNNVIPYKIDDNFQSYQVYNIKKHIRQIENRTCLRWTPLEKMSNATKYVNFVPTNERRQCYFREYKFKTGIISQITLGDDCFPPESESVIHEMLHTLGFTHEHQRVDRDCYVEVDDVAARTDDAFKIIYDDLAFQRWPYDKRSVMHYRRLQGLLKDKDEGWFWMHRLGDTHGIFARIVGEQYGLLTYLDTYKINYRFCGAPDFCDTRPEMCNKIAADEYEAGCVSNLLWDIALGKVKPSNQGGK